MTFHWIGRRISQREDDRLVAGRGTYVADISLPGMLEMAVLRSPHPHARIRRVEPPDRKHCELFLSAAEVEAHTRPFRQQGLTAETRPLCYYALPRDRVRYVGEPVAAVVARDRYRAEDVLESIRVTYEPLPPVVTAREALAPGAPRLWDDWPDNVMIDHRIRSGEPEAALAAADRVVEDTVRIQRHTGMPLETRGLVAHYDGELLTVWANNQWPHILRIEIAACLGLPEARVRVIAPDVGGAFGVKNQFYPEDVLVPLAALQLRRPVRWLEDRREHLLGTAHARDQDIHIRLGFQRDGTLTVVQAEARVDLGAGNILIRPVGLIAAGGASLPMGYRFRHYAYRGVGFVTNKTPSGAYRGFGVPEVCQALETIMDRAAREFGGDPLELRRQNLIGSEDLPYTTPTGGYLTTSAPRDSLDAVLEAVDVRSFRARQAAAQREWRPLPGQGRIRLGLGTAAYVEGLAAGKVGDTGRWGNWEYARVVAHPDGGVTVFSGLAGQCQGHATTLAQVAAETLGLDVKDVRVVLGDTDRVAFGLGAFASRGAMMGGAALLRACEDLKKKLCRLGALLLEADPADVEYRQGGVQVRGAPGRRVTYAELVRIAYTEEAPKVSGVDRLLEGQGIYDRRETEAARPVDPEGRVSRYTEWSDGAAAAVCALDPETGEVRLLQLVLAHDCGRIINPVAVDGQCIGGLVQAVGGVFLEDLPYDENGQPLATTLLDYLLPTTLDVAPDVRLIHRETPSRFIPGGFKGMGEGASIVGPAAILNAVADALAPWGGRLPAPPLTPDRLFRGQGPV